MSHSAEFFEAIKAGNRQRCDALLAEDPGLAGAATAEGVSPILLALYHGQREIALWLAVQKSNLSIFEAAALGKTDRLTVLLDADAGLIGIHSTDGFGVLGLAVFFGHSEATALLLARGGDPNDPARNATQVTALHAAAAQRDPELAVRLTRMLLANGADPNRRQQQEWTPLHAAAHSGNTVLVQLLLAMGADPKPVNAHGKTPADLALEAGFVDFATALRLL